MPSVFRSARSTEAPMDYEYTDRPQPTPSWIASQNPGTPKKRGHDALNPTLPAFGTPSTPTFGSNQNIPFIFQPPQPPQTTSAHPWAPPPNFSPTKAFPTTPLQEELKDVEMTELSPPKPDETTRDAGRVVAVGGMRRVYRARMARGTLKTRRREHDGESGEESEDDEGGQLTTQNTSNHYTLNMPALPPPQSDTPYVLLGYLQFFFNFSLILLFLYLTVQFILTVQRDVEHRISEYSMDIVQEIAMCALQYKNNMCVSNAIPAMAQPCADWETCMNRDPTKVGRAKVGAELIAEVVNGFVEPISWKTLLFTLTSLSFLTVFINSLLSLYRTRHQPVPTPAGHPPPPYPNHLGGFIPPVQTSGWAPLRSNAEEQGVPPRRRRLEGGTSIKLK